MTLTIRLSQEFEVELRARLDERGMTLSEFVREAIAEKLDREVSEKPSAYELGKYVFGRRGSGRDDLSSNRKTILSELFHAKRSR